jgi:hypothetical protein
MTKRWVKTAGRVRLSGALVDRATQRWVIRTGREVAFADDSWLDGPVGSPSGIGERWIAEHASRLGARVVEEPDTGLIPDLEALDGPGFRAEGIRPEIRTFYETTACYELDAWSQWRRWAEPGGRALNAVFARRLRQLSLPLNPLETAHGMDSRVLSLRSGDGTSVGTAWLRRLRATGATVFSGCYGTTMLPGATQPSVRVVFPLPNGSLTVLLRPEVTADRALRLTSPHGTFGSEGAYLVVRPAGASHGWARRIPLPEQFDVFVDARGELRCDHQLCFGDAEILRLHYRMRPSSRHHLR